MTWKCPTCGEDHAGLPRDIGFRWPDAYLAVPEPERAARCWGNEDFCVVDAAYFIRCFLPVPITGTGDVFGWGVWARVDQERFEQALTGSKLDCSKEPPFPGVIANDSAGYPDLEGTPVTVQLGSETDRPSLTVRACNRTLYSEQRDGVTLHRLEEILRAVLPHRFS